MRRRLAAVAVLAVALVCAESVAAQQHPASGDTGFAAMQARGHHVMGVDQYTSTHRFDDLPDGGRIMLQRAPSDTAGVRTIRAHLRMIAQNFAAGDFAVPGFVHAQEVPGTATMRRRRAAISYRFEALPGGGQVRILTRDAAAVEAVHAFLAFQRDAHHADGNAL